MIERETITVEGEEIETIVRGEGPRTIVFFHGFPDTFETFAPLFEAWSLDGYRLVSVPLPGYAGRDIADRFRVDELTRAIVRRVSASSTDEVLVVGHDWGGIAAWSLAAHADASFAGDRSVRLVGVVAMSVPPLWRYITNSLRHPSQLTLARYVFRFQVPILPERSLRKGDYVRDLWERWSAGPVPNAHVDRVMNHLADRPRAALAYYRGLRSLAFDGDLRGFVRQKPAIPALGLYGDEDGCIDVDLWRDVEGWTTSETRLLRLRGVGHFPQWEAPEQTVEAISRFAAERFGA